MPPLSPPATPTAATNDVLKDLFGPISFPELLSLLAPHVDDLLWSIDCIGADDIKRIKASKKPARELVLHLRAHKDNGELNDAFRAAVMKRVELRHQVVGHKEPSRKHMSLPLAPTSEQLQQSRELLLPSVRRSTQRSLPFPELRHPEQWEREVLQVLTEGSIPLVVTFYDATELLPEDFVSAMVILAKGCHEEAGPLRASFRKASMGAIRERAEAIVADPITEFPTTLILFKDGYRQVDGPDVERIRRYVFKRSRTARQSSASHENDVKIQAVVPSPISSNLATPPPPPPPPPATTQRISRRVSAPPTGKPAMIGRPSSPALVPIFIDNRLSERGLILQWLAETSNST